MKWGSKYKSKSFEPASSEAFRLSRSKIDLFVDCPRCFYMDRRLGVGRPPGFPFSLNNAVDTLLKKEFDIHRAKGTRHPLVKEYGIYAVPFEHEKMEEWRDAMRRGIQYLHPDTNFNITGGIDDVWVDAEAKLNIVDYKATSKQGEVSLDAEWQNSYKRQVEVYQWLFRKNGFDVSDTAYFVYCNGKTDKEAFDAKLEFDIKIIPYVGKDDWIDGTLNDIRVCLTGDLPALNDDCDYCAYRVSAKKVEK